MGILSPFKLTKQAGGVGAAPDILTPTIIAFTPFWEDPGAYPHSFVSPATAAGTITESTRGNSFPVEIKMWDAIPIDWSEVESSTFVPITAAGALMTSTASDATVYVRISSDPGIEGTFVLGARDSAGNWDYATIIWTIAPA